MKRSAIRYIVLFLLIISVLPWSRWIFPAGMPCSMSPFLFLARLTGGTVTVAVAILPLLLLLAAVWRRRFFCRFCCPLGCGFDLVRRVRKRLVAGQGTTVSLRFPWLGAALAAITLLGVATGSAILTRGLMFDPLVLFTSLFGGSTLNFAVVILLLLLAGVLPWFWCGTCCPLGAIQEICYRMSHWKRTESDTVTRQSRRRFLRAAVALAAFGMSLPYVAVRGLVRKLRPPGALDESRFASLCTGCGRCIAVCPTKHLRAEPEEERTSDEKRRFPFQYSPLPVVDTETTWCEKNCISCGQVCPSGAIQRFTVEEKEHLRVGAIEYNFEHCVLYAEKDCDICVRECPWEAITMTWSDEWSIETPHVDPLRCTGCARCVVMCPGFDPIYHGEPEDGVETAPPKAFTLVPRQDDSPGLL